MRENSFIDSESNETKPLNNGDDESDEEDEGVDCDNHAIDEYQDFNADKRNSTHPLDLLNVIFLYSNNLYRRELANKTVKCQ